MTSNAPHLFGGQDGTTTITLDAKQYRGVMLDRIDARGPRGGKVVLYRAASKRSYQVATWSDTMAEAAR